MRYIVYMDGHALKCVTSIANDSANVDVLECNGNNAIKELQHKHTKLMLKTRLRNIIVTAAVAECLARRTR